MTLVQYRVNICKVEQVLVRNWQNSLFNYAKHSGCYLFNTNRSSLIAVTTAPKRVSTSNLQIMEDI